MSNRTLFVSTAIPYVNAPPHLGFALEVVLADVIARQARADGERVCFTSGTDDHSLKNVRAAEAAASTTREYVDGHASRYRDLQRVLGATFDDFVRTSADPRHADAVRDLWERCARAGDLEKRAYRGLYCVGCEQFFEATESHEGQCPEHRTPLEIVEEENWFFRLSRYRERIEDAIRSRELAIYPASRAREIVRFVDGGLVDVSVSRSVRRARGWGIPVPGDDAQVVSVWFDALANYLVNDAWKGASRRVHVIGKGINRFHSVLWPALLTSAALPLPTDLLVHGYVTIEGRKIGKSFGNGVDPGALVERYGTDAVRYFLLRFIGPTEDGDFDRARFEAVYTSDLANALGNLVTRTLTLVGRHPDFGPPEPPESNAPGAALSALSRALEATARDAIVRFAPHEALRAIWRVVDAANQYISDAAPWKQEGQRLATIVRDACGALRAIAAALAPLLPDTAAQIASALADPSRPPPILFPRIERSPQRR